MIKKLIRANLADLALCCGVISGAFLLIHVITLGVLFFTKSNTSLLLSGLVLPIFAGIMCLIVSASHVIVSFPMAMKCSQTRRRALGLTLSMIVFLALCSMGLAALLTVLERMSAPALWKLLTGAQAVAVGPESAVVFPDGIPYTQVLEVEVISLPWMYFLLIAVGSTAAGFIMGAVIQRFGGKGAWFFWGVWMLFCFGFQLLPWKQYTIVDWLLPLIGVIFLAGLIWSAWSLLHSVVKS